MKIALLSDIHGNDLALEAVLNAASQIGAEKLLIAGDFVGYYYRPDRVFELLSDWDWCGVKGNHETMLGDWAMNLNCEDILSKYGSGIAKAFNNLSDEQLEYLDGLPYTKRLTINNLTVFLCHDAPWGGDCYIYPNANKNIREKLFSEGFDLLVYGHTHYPVIWSKGRQLIVNPGSVGQQRDHKPGACWALWDTEKHKVTLLRENYNYVPLVKECTEIDPQLPYLATVLSRVSKIP